MEASVSDEEKHAVPNVPEKLFKNSSLRKNNSREAAKSSFIASQVSIHLAHVASLCTPGCKAQLC